MNIKEAISKLEQDNKFKSFMKQNPDYYLVHAFTMLTDKQEDWQLGYYSKETDKVVVFEVGKTIKKIPEQDVLKDQGVVAGLNMENIKMDYENALQVAERAKIEKHGREQINKKILILQKIDMQQVYNITMVTGNFNIVNVKINAETGQVLSNTKNSIMSLGQKVK